MKETVTYFSDMGKVNTVKALRIAKEKALEAGIRNIIIASTHGFSAKNALETFCGVDAKLIVVGGKRRYFSQETAEKIEEGDTEWSSMRIADSPTPKWLGRSSAGSVRA